MNTNATSDVLKVALKLPDRERAALALGSLESLDDDANFDADEVEGAWAAEVERRLVEVRSGSVQPVDGLDAIALVRGELRR